MFELIYGISIFFYFLILKLITTYGYTKEETSYYSSRKEKAPFTRLSEMPIPRLVFYVIIGIIPVVNTGAVLVGFLYAAHNGFGPTSADVSEWFKNRKARKNKDVTSAE